MFNYHALSLSLTVTQCLITISITVTQCLTACHCHCQLQSKLDYPNPRLSELEIQRICRVKVHIPKQCLKCFEIHHLLFPILCWRIYVLGSAVVAVQVHARKKKQLYRPRCQSLDNNQIATISYSSFQGCDTINYLL